MSKDEDKLSDDPIENLPEEHAGPSKIFRERALAARDALAKANGGTPPPLNTPPPPEKEKFSPVKRSYLFKGWHQFNSFCSSNYEWLFPSIRGDSEKETGAHLLFKDQVDMFKKSCQNAQGGCPCNRAKRKALAEKMYLETVEVFSKCRDVHKVAFNLLNNPDEIHFLKAGQESSLAVGKQEPWIVIKKS